MPRVMIVDDSVVVRRLVTRALECHGGVKVVGAAVNGVDALFKLGPLHPDLLILDLEMPEMNGHETLRRVRRSHPHLPVIVFSHHTTQGAESTLQALADGATAFALKPTAKEDFCEEYICAELAPLIHTLTASTQSAPPAPALPPSTPRRAVEAVVIGVSTGGPAALSAVITGLPPDLAVPVLVVQHMPARFTQLLAERLDDQAEISVTEAADGCAVESGHVYLAPGGHHMAIGRTDKGVAIEIHEGPPENFCRPSVDVLFRSAADVWGSGVLAVVMTGMGHDGLRGAEIVYRAGGLVIAQTAASCVVPTMAAGVAAAGLAHELVPLNALSDALRRHVRGLY